MSCLITSGINVSACRDSIPGVKRLIIGNFDQLVSYDELAGVITGITLSGTSSAYEFKVNLNSSSLVQTPTVSVENNVSYITAVVSATFGKMDVSKRNLLKIMMAGSLFIIVQDNNNLYWAVGFSKPAYLSGGSFSTGVGSTDANGLISEFTAMEQYPACEVDASIIAGLL